MTINPFARIRALEAENARLRAQLAAAQRKLSAGARARQQRQHDRVMTAKAILDQQLGRMG